MPFVPAVELAANMRAPTLGWPGRGAASFHWSPQRMGSRPVMVEGLVTSSHKPSQHSGLAWARRSAGVRRQIDPEFIVTTRPLAGLYPMFISPCDVSAVEPPGFSNTWNRGTPGAGGSAVPKFGAPPQP